PLALAISIMRLLPSNGKILDGEILLDGIDILKLPEDEMRKVRWNKISVIFQGAMNALNPVNKVGDQVIEALNIHEKLTKKEMRDKAEYIFDLVGLDSSWMKNYPHELSGGMKQRVIIAMSLICNPQLIIADEPTTALDVVMQDQILYEINNLQKKIDISMIYISHDMSVLAEVCDKIAIMYGGKIVESTSTENIIKNSHHPYTIALVNAFPNIKGPKKQLISISGVPPDLRNPPLGCYFEPRCPFAKQICKKEPPPAVKISEGHYSYCHYALDPRIQELQRMM
ncbi:ABC transporter ATP-binding protein, partial [Thermoproteota archaeon]